MITTSVSSASSMALGRYAILRTRDLDEATSRVSCVLSPHELSIARQGDHLDAEMCHAPLGGVSINRLRYGATVDIDVGRTKDFVLVMMPLVTENGGALDYLANMSGLEPGDLRHVLERLVTLNLVDRRGDLREYRYTIHGLTRAFLQQQVVRWGA